MESAYAWIPIAMKLPIGEVDGRVLTIEIRGTARVLVHEKTTQDSRVEFTNETFLTVPTTILRDSEEDAIDEDRRILRSLRSQTA